MEYMTGPDMTGPDAFGLYVWTMVLLGAFGWISAKAAWSRTGGASPGTCAAGSFVPRVLLK